MYSTGTADETDKHTHRQTDRQCSYELYIAHMFAGWQLTEVADTCLLPLLLPLPRINAYVHACLCVDTYKGTVKSPDRPQMPFMCATTDFSASTVHGRVQTMLKTCREVLSTLLGLQCSCESSIPSSSHVSAQSTWLLLFTWKLQENTHLL